MPDQNNALIHETSPYLLQHAGNPVEWRPWSQAALNDARQEDKPIFLSIGYATCHWCHVMAHESFEDPETARLINERFIAIKVDREERPDIDAYYMKAVQMLTGSGGWPMSVFLTPEGVPFFGGTYFPPVRRGSMPAFKELLTAISESWQKDRNTLLSNGQAIQQRIARLDVSVTSELPPWTDIIQAGIDDAASHYDERHGGFTAAPKFPQPTQLIFLLKTHAATGDTVPLRMALHTMDAMADGGIHDQIGGGFHRYSVDKEWLVPHFEKMLYDQAMLLDAYTLAFQITRKPQYAQITEKLVSFVKREMLDSQGGFYSALDADSEGAEGLFYIWTRQELQTMFSDYELRLLESRYELPAQGNWEGRLILRRHQSSEAGAESADMETMAYETALAPLEARLLQERHSRKRPITDRKILTDWNSLMLSALARASHVFQKPDWLDLATDSLHFIEKHLIKDSLLHHSHCGQLSDVQGFLSDYAYFTQALITLYEATGEHGYRQKAVHWHDETSGRFADAGGGFYFDRPSNSIPHRQRQASDSPLPSPEAVALSNERVIRIWQSRPAGLDAISGYYQRELPMMQQFPSAMGTALSLLLAAERDTIVTFQESPDRALVDTVLSHPWPGRTVIYQKPSGLEGVSATVQICAGQVCLLPVRSPQGVTRQLDSLQKPL